VTEYGNEYLKERLNEGTYCLVFWFVQAFILSFFSHDGINL